MIFAESLAETAVDRSSRVGFVSSETNVVSVVQCARDVLGLAFAAVVVDCLSRRPLPEQCNWSDDASGTAMVWSRLKLLRPVPAL